MVSSIEINQSIFKKFIKLFLRLFNYKIVRINNFNDRYNDFIAEATEEEIKIINKFAKFSLTTKANLWSIIQSLKYLDNNNIHGDVVECGVYKGGTLAMILRFLNDLKVPRKIYGYDKFEEGLRYSQLTSHDKTIKGESFFDFNNNNSHRNEKQKNFNPIKYLPEIETDNVILVKGDIHETLTIEKNIPKKIAFLRMDTDFYSTTKTQLEILYPRLIDGGVLHIDDYGTCPGVKKAVDDYFASENIWLHRVDYTCRLLVKKVEKK